MWSRHTCLRVAEGDPIPLDHRGRLRGVPHPAFAALPASQIVA